MWAEHIHDVIIQMVLYTWLFAVSKLHARWTYVCIIITYIYTCHVHKFTCIIKTTCIYIHTFSSLFHLCSMSSSDSSRYKWTTCINREKNINNTFSKQYDVYTYIRIYMYVHYHCHCVGWAHRLAGSLFYPVFPQWKPWSAGRGSRRPAWGSWCSIQLSVETPTE